MLTQENIYVILFSLPVYQLLFYTVQLISFKKSNPSRKYLGMLLFSMSLFLVMNAVYHLGYFQIFALLFYIFMPVLLAVPPIYFLYILSLTRENHDISFSSRFVLFIPPLMVAIVNGIVYGLLPHEDKMSFFRDGFRVPEIAGRLAVYNELLFWVGAVGLLFLQIILAYVRIQRILRKESFAMRQQPAHLAYLEMKWIIGISAALMAFVVVNGLVNVVAPTRNMAIAIIYNIVMIVTGGIVGYLGMKQDALLNQVSKMSSISFSDAVISESQNMRPEIKITLAAAGLLTSTEVESILSALKSLMEKEKPYLDPNFSMSRLCDLASISRRKMTYVINDVMKKNFYGVINEYRIQEATELFKKDSQNQLKIESIAEMVGFQSKSSFNACFKKFTGQTPSEFKTGVK